MKRIILLGVILSLVFISCGISTEEHQKVQDELAAVKAENSDLKTEMSAVKKQLETTSTGIRDAIVAANEEFMAFFSKGDAAGLAALYTENGQLLPPNSGIITGREAIQALWQGVFGMGIKSVKLETVDVEGTGNTAAEVGKYEMQDGEGKTLDTGKYMVIWKKVAGQWKLHRDIWNSSITPPKK